MHVARNDERLPRSVIITYRPLAHDALEGESLVARFFEELFDVPRGIYGLA